MYGTAFSTHHTRFWFSLPALSPESIAVQASKMRSPSLWGPIFLVVYFLFGEALSNRLPLDEIFKKELEKKAQDIEKRDLVCDQDDTLESFQQYSEDSVPFCSTYLSIGISTSTVPTTGRTSGCLLLDVCATLLTRIAAP